jgi:hypothetical protein
MLLEVNNDVDDDDDEDIDNDGTKKDDKLVNTKVYNFVQRNLND